MKNIFFATFGHGQEYYGHYVEIEAVDRMSAHKRMLKEFGNKWAFIYEQDQFKEAIEKYGYKFLRKLIA